MKRLGFKPSLFLVIAVILLVPPMIDVLNGKLKTETGCHVVWVMDGDTIKVNCRDKGFAVARVIGYDAPEKNARCVGEFVMAIRATWALRMMLWQARTIKIKRQGNDRYGRYLIVLQVNGNDLAQRMIKTGLARSYDGGRRGSWCE